MKKLGFVGLGTMGLPMAANLAKAGFTVTGYDLRQEARSAFATQGGIAATALHDAFAGQDGAILMVVSIGQAEDILFGQGAAEALPKGGVVILMATCPPGAVKALGAKLEAKGLALIDAPVSGGVSGARSATLTIMAAAPEPVFARAEAALKAMGSRLTYLGSEIGQGSTAKAVNQLLCGAHIAIAAEGLSLAEKLGVDAGKMLEILSGSAASSWMLKDRGPRMLQSEPEVASAVDIFVKDLGIVLEAGRDAKAALPMAALAHQLFLSVSGQGLGHRDDSQVIEAYRALQGRSGPAA